MISSQLASCSMLTDYLTVSGQSLFKPTASIPTNIFEYDFIQPRRSELPLVTHSKLDETASRQPGFTYYSASGYRCYTISVASLQAVCDINGQWAALAPILNHQYE